MQPVNDTDTVGCLMTKTLPVYLQKTLHFVYHDTDTVGECNKLQVIRTYKEEWKSFTSYV